MIKKFNVLPSFLPQVQPPSLPDPRVYVGPTSGPQTQEYLVFYEKQCFTGPSLTGNSIVLISLYFEVCLKLPTRFG